MLQRLGNFAQQADHPGLEFTRLAQDIFQIDTSTGPHHCIVTEPQGASIRTLQDVFPNAILPKLLVKSLVHRLVISIDWLHATCGLVHTDISPQNVLIKLEDDSVLKDIEKQESQNPSTPVISQGVPIYHSLATMLELSGLPVLTDFGQMRPSEPANRDWWMSDLYRAPEVLLQLPWSFPVDIWSIGVMILELLEGKNLFDPIDRTDDHYVLPLALAQYIGYLGPPPLEIIKQNPLFTTYFDDDGNWTSDVPIPQTSLEEFVTTIPPGKEKEAFLRFIRKILTWDAEVRATSVEIIPSHPPSQPISLSHGQNSFFGNILPENSVHSQNPIPSGAPLASFFHSSRGGYGDGSNTSRRAYWSPFRTLRRVSN
ncbi:kinase-like protein [Aspergillus heteromorphus CBS 117.55]|uniref:EKC/KEOPS complex subunit BUD32 n=1 Tax=Aspergillus heteromorphus CBS 117.55 TaxID=1448321 RepID=A0A317W9R3_9EURO|nr:kinase-like protein [Aspergillus heteromorphus CBS 117.55]PWY82057.1 kinase-like protein [Aspergillus heteromorphus CBS 117.55]